MGMSDQYDDGRYDRSESNSERTDRLMDGRYESVILPGGWQVPADQMPGWPFNDLARLITPVRGGMKYPTPTQKGTTVARKTKHQIDKELAKNRELIEVLQREQRLLIEESRQAIPAEPPPAMTMFTVSVRFTMRGKHYQYLVLRNGREYYTTATDAKRTRFASWEALCEWLEGPDVYSHTDLEVLRSADKVVSFDSGKVEKLPIQQPPF